MHLLRGALPRLLTSVTPTPPPVVSYRRTQLAHLSGGALPHLLSSENYVAFGHFLLTKPISASIGRAFSTPPHIENSQDASVRLLPVHSVGTSPGRDPYHATLHWQHPPRFRLDPTGTPKWCISRYGTLPRLLTLATHTPPLVVCYRRTQLLHLSGGDLPRLLTSAHLGRLRSSPTGVLR